MIYICPFVPKGPVLDDIVLLVQYHHSNPPVCCEYKSTLVLQDFLMLGLKSTLRTLLVSTPRSFAMGGSLRQLSFIAVIFSPLGEYSGKKQIYESNLCFCKWYDG